MIEFAKLGDTEAHYQQSFAGDTYNTAVYLARLGVPVAYLTQLGDDSFSKQIIASMEAENVDASNISLCAGRKPGLYLIENDETGERKFSYWRDSSPARELFAQPHSLSDATTFYFSGITLAICRRDVAKLVTLLCHLKEDGCRIVFDTNFRPALWDDLEQAQRVYQQILAHCGSVLTSLEDELALRAVKTVTECKTFYSKIGVEELIIKDFDLVTYGFNSNESVSVQASRIPARDTTGAGDAFNAGYLAAQHAGADLEGSILFAQLLSAEVVQRMGAIIALEDMPELSAPKNKF